MGTCSPLASCPAIDDGSRVAVRIARHIGACCNARRIIYAGFVSSSGGTSEAPGAVLGGLFDSGAGGEDEATERILLGVLGQIEDFGVRRFTVDDLARRLGMSRVTIYRRFEKKSRLLEAAFLYEHRRILAEVNARVERCETLEERLIEGFVSILLILRGHGLLNRVLSTEPELILPVLTVRGAPVVAAGREFIAAFARHEAEQGGVVFREDQLDALSELLARTVLSFVLTPQSVVSLDTPEEAREFARRYLAPVLRAMGEFELKSSTSQGG
jgi:AcrR family transcriptional regulator